MNGEHVYKGNTMPTLTGKAERKSHKSETSLTENLYRFLMQDILHIVVHTTTCMNKAIGIHIENYLCE